MRASGYKPGFNVAENGAHAGETSATRAAAMEERARLASAVVQQA